MSEASEHVRDAADAMVELLRPQAGRDWSVPAGTLTWSCWTTAAHVGHDLVAYAGQLAARAHDRYLPFDLTVAPDATPADVLDVVAMAGEMLATIVASVPPSTRAWHYGAVDPIGFAAMGVGETIVHTFDIATGLGLDWRPSSPLSAFVVGRLLPEHAHGAPADVLLSSTGRRAMGDEGPATNWVWRAAL